MGSSFPNSIKDSKKWHSHKWDKTGYAKKRRPKSEIIIKTARTSRHCNINYVLNWALLNAWTFSTHSRCLCSASPARCRYTSPSMIIWGDLERGREVYSCPPPSPLSLPWSVLRGFLSYKIFPVPTPRHQSPSSPFSSQMTLKRLHIALIWH